MKGVYNNYIFYKKGYKYQLTRSYLIYTGIPVNEQIETDYFIFFKNGLLIIKRGYAWNGASGIPDCKCNLRASLVHDALYQAMRLKLIDRSYRKDADRLLFKICKEDNMPSFFAKIVYEAVKLFGGKFIRRRHEPKELTCP